MTNRSPVLRFTIDQPCDNAVRRVKRALADKGLRTATELDITERLRQEMFANLVPSIVLYVDDPVLLLEAVMLNPGAALYIPQPIVITGKGRYSEICINGRETLMGSRLPSGSREPVLSLHSRVVDAVDSIAVLEDVGMSVRT